ncbi:MAG: diguanylate cyclase, partial [Candidatus Thiodiazotropha sp. (ex Cardiolucina cf. quadrata)]|nr:diguanylate cyclase [Candidatus Thiodiazotropha sp. (ex Cardiolucina cf. quadrata)]
RGTNRLSKIECLLCLGRIKDITRSKTHSTVSVGVSAYRLGESSEDFIQRCDKALYRSKALGRNRVTIAG